MQVKNPILDDLARVASGALGAAAGVKEEVESLLRERLARLLDGMDLVEREEFDAVKAMAAKARTEQDALAKRVADLEARLAALEGPAAGKRRSRAPGKVKEKGKPQRKAKGQAKSGS